MHPIRVNHVIIRIIIISGFYFSCHKTSSKFPYILDSKQLF